MATESEKLIDRPITWRSIIRVGLIWAAEYAMLSLIEDSPPSLKVATILCALAALAAMEFEPWIESKKKNLSHILIGVAAFVYLVFVAYALNSVAEKREIKRTLQKLYSRSTPITTQSIIVHDSEKAQPKTLDQIQVKQEITKFEAWERDTAAWIGEHLGDAARDRFLDRSQATAFPFMGYAPVYDPAYAAMRLQLADERRNLLSILESRIYAE